MKVQSSCIITVFGSLNSCCVYLASRLLQNQGLFWGKLARGSIIVEDRQSSHSTCCWKNEHAQIQRIKSPLCLIKTLGSTALSNSAGRVSDNCGIKISTPSLLLPSRKELPKFTSVVLETGFSGCPQQDNIK